MKRYHISTRNWFLALLVAALALLCVLLWQNHTLSRPIRIGVLHSLTGTMSSSERPLIDALQLAVEEINTQGGLLGRTLELVIADGQSDPDTFAHETERLITQEKVSVLFGCWTSSCRKAVKPIVEKHQHLLFYPLQYEGLEISPNIIYTGAAPNQQIIPGTHWALHNLGKRVYLIGSDYVFPYIANKIMMNLIETDGGEVLGERYLPLGSKNVAVIIQDIQTLKPDVILNTVNGSSNDALFSALSQAQLQHIPIVSFSIAENEISAWPHASTLSHYAVWSYFQSLDTVENKQFVARFKQRFGQNHTINNPMVASYIGLHLWAQAVRETGFIDAERIQPAIIHQSMKSPAGIVAIDPGTRHMWQTPMVGKVQNDGQFVIVWRTDHNQEPEPYPAYRSREAWEKVQNLYKGQQP